MSLCSTDADCQHGWLRFWGAGHSTRGEKWSLAKFKFGNHLIGEPAGWISSDTPTPRAEPGSTAPRGHWTWCSVGWCPHQWTQWHRAGPPEALKVKNESHSVMSNSLRPQGLYSPWNSPGLNTGMGSLSLLQGIFLTQRSNPGLLHCRQILYQLNHKDNPRVLEFLTQELGSPALQADSLPTEPSGKTFPGYLITI